MSLEVELNKRRVKAKFSLLLDGKRVEHEAGKQDDYDKDWNSQDVRHRPGLLILTVQPWPVSHRECKSSERLGQRGVNAAAPRRIYATPLGVNAR